MYSSDLVLMATALVSSIACGGSPTSPSLDSVSITLTGTGVTSYTYTANIASIMADCTPCHGATLREAGYNFTTYAGVMAAVTAGSQNSKLVKATQPNGPMFVNFTGNRTTKAQTIYDWVVNSKAAQ